MTDLNDLLKPGCDMQREVTDLWNIITPDEQNSIKHRMDDLFKNGLPFTLKHEKIIYINLFQTLAQIDLVACQIPLKFESKIATPEFKQRLRRQLLDEIFHVMLSLKIVYMLSSPYSHPPELNDNTKKFREFLAREDNLNVAVIFFNLISEGIAEELVEAFHRSSVAPEVFEIILQDERRHVSDADVYIAIGLPDKKLLGKKIVELEDHILSTLIFQFNVSMSMSRVLGVEGLRDYFTSVDQKYKEQLNKLNLNPGKKWSTTLHFCIKALASFPKDSKPVEIEMTALRKLSMTQWDNPSDPTMVGQFNIDVSCLEFFEKKYPSDTLTSLMLQTISQILVKHPEYSLFISDEKIFCRTKANASLVVKLPDCDDHMGFVSFQDCHTLPVAVLSARIRQIISMMVFCYKKREQLELEYPELRLLQKNYINEMGDKIFRPVLPTIPGVCLSNIGAFGYTQSKSPLLANEAAKITIMAVQRTPVWCQTSKTFIARDLLPVSASIDHRIYGGNIPLPKIMDRAFQDVFAAMLSNTTKSESKEAPDIMAKYNKMTKRIDALLAKNLQFGYLALTTLQTLWLDYLSVDDLFETLLNNSENLQPA